MRIPTKFLLSHNSGSSDFIFSSCFRRENADYLIGNQRFVKVIPLRFERRTHALEGRCSIQLSYGTILNGSGAYGTRTRDPMRDRHVF